MTLIAFSHFPHSAAHCFWKDLRKKLPASEFGVAIGKIHRSWDSDEDAGAQKSDVCKKIAWVEPETNTFIFCIRFLCILKYFIQLSIHYAFLLLIQN